MLCNQVEREFSVNVAAVVFWQEVLSVCIAAFSDDRLVFVCNTHWGGGVQIRGGYHEVIHHLAKVSANSFK